MCCMYLSLSVCGSCVICVCHCLCVNVLHVFVIVCGSCVICVCHCLCVNVLHVFVIVFLC